MHTIMNSFVAVFAICCIFTAKARPGHFDLSSLSLGGGSGSGGEYGGSSYGGGSPAPANLQLVGVPDESSYADLTYPQYQIQELGTSSHGSLPPEVVKIVKTITVKVPQPYPVKVPHPIPVPVPVAKPYPVPVTKLVHVPQHVPVEVIKKIAVPVEVPKPYPVSSAEFSHGSSGGDYGSYGGSIGGGDVSISQAYGGGDFGHDQSGGYSAPDPNYGTQELNNETSEQH